jgi:hypothetical protein
MMFSYGKTEMTGLVVLIINLKEMPRHSPGRDARISGAKIRFRIGYLPKRRHSMAEIFFPASLFGFQCM